MALTAADMANDPLLADLTEPQRQAVTHVQGPLLVLAGAGSGKTRVITRRIAWLVLRVGLAPWNILAITFTNKAAGEMRERVARLVSERQARAITICTFHSLCARLLRQYARQAGLPENYSIYDTGDQERAVKRALERLQISGTNFPPSRVLAAISNAKNDLVGPEEFARQAHDFSDRHIARIYHQYQEQLQKSQALDFDDLLMRTVALMRQHAEVLQELRERFQYILIDEYQDTNHAQFILANALASGSAQQQNICATGDPDQSIYGWRGANIQNILEFEQHYPRTAVVRLEQNYRSTKHILAVADHLIQFNQQRKHKRLWTENEAGRPVQVAVCFNEQQEAGWVAHEIRRHRAQDQIAYGDMAVFYRLNSLSRVVEDALRNAGIPYQIARGTAFYERKEIKDAVAYLRAIANPADEVNLLRILNTPARGISEATAKGLQAQAVARNQTVYEILQKPQHVPGLNTRALNAIRAFATLLEKWRFVAGLWEGARGLGQGASRQAASAPASLSTESSPLAPSPLPHSGGAPSSDLEHQPSLRGFVEQVLRESGLHALYKADKADPDQERLANLGELVSSAQQFETDYEKLHAQDRPALTLARKLAAYLEQISLVSDQDALNSTQGSVTLMTLHAAKGLEFPVVFIVGLEDGLLPHSRCRDHPDQMEEERRLCFVGITRAKRFLSLSRVKFRTVFGKTTPTIPSPFLRELPQASVAVTDLSAGSAGPALDEGDEVQAFLDDEEGMVPGARVRHAMFGLGRILKISGSGPHARVLIRFETYGTKTLVLEHAHLEPA